MEPTTLELQAQGELDDPRIQSSGYLAKVPGVESGRNCLEARVVPDVEKFRAELELDPFADGKRFVQGPIPGIFRRTLDQAGPAVSEGAERRRREGRLIEPLRDFLWAGYASNTVRSRGQPVSPGRHTRSEGKPTFDYRDPGECPAPKRLSGKVAAVLKDREIVNISGGENMRAVPRRPPILRLEVARVLGAGGKIPEVQAAPGHVRQYLAVSVGARNSEVLPGLVLPSYLQRIVVRGSEIPPGCAPAIHVQTAPPHERPGRVRRD